jgi:hypothetical protein
LLDGSFREYQRSAQRWWNAIAPAVPAGRPVYFVSSNSHSLANLLGGYARNHRDEILAFLNHRNFEDLAPRYDEAIAAGDTGLATNILYYALRAYIHAEPAAWRREPSDAANGRADRSPGKSTSTRNDRARSCAPTLDPRLRMPGSSGSPSSESSTSTTRWASARTTCSRGWGRARGRCSACT